MMSDEAIPEVKPGVDHRLSLRRRLRRDLGALMEYAWELSGSIRKYRVDAVLLEGEESGTGDRLRVFYLGRYDNFAFVLGRLFADFEVLERQRNVNSLRAHRWVEQYASRVDLVFLDLELLYCRLQPTSVYLQIPQWLRQKYKVPGSWQEVIGSLRKNTKTTDLRKVRKYDLTFRITCEEEDFLRFYREMYAPYLRERFRDEVIIEPEAKVLRQCRKGELMHIVRDGRVVAAVLLHQLGGRLAYVWVGVPEGLSREMQKGAFSAMYYYTLLYGYRQGCDEIDFLGSRPLLNDGLFRYKRKWGTYVEDSPVPRGDIMLRPMNWSRGLQSFFASNPFIARNGQQLVGKILCRDSVVSSDEIEKIRARLGTPGVSELQIFSQCGFTTGPDSCDSSHLNGIELVDLSACAQPEEGFCHRRG